MNQFAGLRKGRLNVVEEILINLRQENEKALQAGKLTVGLSVCAGVLAVIAFY